MARSFRAFAAKLREVMSGVAAVGFTLADDDPSHPYDAIEPLKPAKT